MAGNSSAAVAGTPTESDAGNKTNPPPEFKVETAPRADQGGPAGEGEKFGQARTPKHANKTKEETGAPRDQQKITPDRGESKPEEGRPSYGPPHGNHPGNFPPPRPYEGRQLGGTGAFHPHEPRRQPPPPGHGEYYSRSPPMHTVSPGGGHHRYFPSSHGGGRIEPGYPPHQNSSGYYDQRGYNEYGPGSARPGYDGPPPSYRGQYQGPPSRSGPPPYQPSSYNGYPPESRGYPPPGGAFNSSQPPYTRPGPPEQYSRPDARYGEQPRSSNGTFSRAVSSSFDRSVRSRAQDEKAPGMHPKSRKSLSPSATHTDASMASEDASWKQLQQVHSVDDAAIRDRIKKKEESEELQVERQPASTSSSLTNSPTDGPERMHAAREARRVVEAAAAATAAGNQQPSSLDSLSSVASAQAPMDTAKPKSGASRSDPPPPSPGNDSASLDLMKCSSGSSGLLHLPTHQRNSEGLLFENKRGRDEERGDVNTAENSGTAEELRRSPSEYADKTAEGQPPSKKVRVQDKTKDEAKTGDSKSKSSPLSITCSPSAEKAKESSRKLKSAKADYASPNPMDGFYDKPPAFSYSLDSAPSIPKDAGHRKQASYPSLPPRPGSSSSSTITPGTMNVDEQNQINAAVPSVHSWEIHAQDSFGNGSLNAANALASSFSFQDYPMINANESDNGSSGIPPGHSNHGPHAPPPPPPPHHHHRGMHPPIESRNQSFEGGHYHGTQGFHRNDSMDGYGTRAGPHGGYASQPGHQGSFPPHAPSWGTAGSGGSHPPPYQGHPPGHYGQYGGRMGHDYHQGGVMRNYSQDSGHRMSPPPGHGGHQMRHPPRGPPPGFQPPSEFAAPHNPHLTRRPPPAVYIMPTSQGGGIPAHKRGNGVFSWSKEDDVRLTEIMKKYKNPRDWEPIAKEHGCGKSAKECHERWIRYLKPGVRKGQWSDQEDAIVIEAVTTSAEQPFTRWSDLAQRLPGRVGKQIRDRWVNHLNPNINHLPFSRDDDLLLWDGHKKLGKRWVEISTKFFENTRSENHIKNRWYSASFKKFIANEFGPEAYAGSKATKSKDDSKKKKTPSAIKEEDPTMEAI